MLAHQIAQSSGKHKILILDKEKGLGYHTSGRNSGVLHAGIYYKPNSLKAKSACQEHLDLRSDNEHKLPISNCGKVIVAQSTHLDSQLDVLAERGQANGASVNLIDQRELSLLIPGAVTSSNRALWSPDTSVTKPIEVINKLYNILIEIGVEIRLNASISKFSKENSNVILSNGEVISYGYMFNCAGPLSALQTISLKDYHTYPYHFVDYIGIYRMHLISLEPIFIQFLTLTSRFSVYTSHLLLILNPLFLWTNSFACIRIRVISWDGKV